MTGITMRMYDIIKKKRDGGILTRDEIYDFINGYVAGEIPDYQAAALCMAIYFQGMTPQETTDLTLAVRDSGETLDCSSIQGIRVDKHSTGGVGDKTSLVVAPIVASLGIKVAKMSGRGLGHTGGTIDKLESIDGFRTNLSSDEFKRVVDSVGLSIIGQSRSLAPADKLLYALRDVTATVDSIPLIASSIMGKKLCADDDCIVLDVKTGSGSFMKSESESIQLAKIMVDIGKRAGKQMMALVTDMDKPLGNAIGNALEVKEAVETLRGGGPSDFRELCVILSASMLYLAKKGSLDECSMIADDALRSGKAFKVFTDMVKAQGGNLELIYHPENMIRATHIHTVRAPHTGYISHVNTEHYGLAALRLGAGRNTQEDPIDHSAGIYLLKKTGDWVNQGDAIAIFYTNKRESVQEAETLLIKATEWGDTPPLMTPLVLKQIL